MERSTFQATCGLRLKTGTGSILKMENISCYILDTSIKLSSYHIPQSSLWVNLKILNILQNFFTVIKIVISASRHGSKCDICLFVFFKPWKNLVHEILFLDITFFVVLKVGVDTGVNVTVGAGHRPILPLARIYVYRHSTGIMCNQVIIQIKMQQLISITLMFF